MAKQYNPTTLEEQRDLIITRVFKAPPELMWKAWTEPEQVKRWWGPKGFTTPVSKIDLRMDGEYLNCMRSPDGKDFWSKGVYREVIRPNHLVMTDSFADEKGNAVLASYYGLTGNWPLELLISVTFEEYQGKTNFTLTQIGVPPGEMFEQTKTGWNESFDKLDKYLKTIKI